MTGLSAVLRKSLKIRKWGQHSLQCDKTSKAVDLFIVRVIGVETLRPKGQRWARGSWGRGPGQQARPNQLWVWGAL